MVYEVVGHKCDLVEEDQEEEMSYISTEEKTKHEL